MFIHLIIVFILLDLGVMLPEVTQETPGRLVDPVQPEVKLFLSLSLSVEYNLSKHFEVTCILCGVLQQL
jgi:hypothetical protein